MLPLDSRDAFSRQADGQRTGQTHTALCVCGTRKSKHHSAERTRPSSPSCKYRLSRSETTRGPGITSSSCIKLDTCAFSVTDSMGEVQAGSIRPLKIAQKVSAFGVATSWRWLSDSSTSSYAGNLEKPCRTKDTTASSPAISDAKLDDERS